tara:strand:- start:16910 stop:17494 length:585 start_codon:yes stop_codon:yes gene_type:complete
MKLTAFEEVEKFFLDTRAAYGDRARIFLGIDPGSTGALAFVHARSPESSVAVDIPTTKIVKKKKGGKSSYRTHTDLGALWELFAMILDNDEFSMIRVVIEHQQPIPRDTALTGFTVGRNFGMWPLFLYSHGMSHETVRPVVWKRKMGLIKKDKEAARLQAQKMFPGASLSRKKDHNRAEALLIAEYARLRSSEE